MATLESKLKLTLIDQVSAGTKRISSALSGFQRQTASFGTPLLGTVARLAAFGAGVMGVTNGIDATVGSAIKFETAFSNVKKVISATEEQFGSMRTSIINLSKQLPMTATDIASIYEAAGQSGIANEDLNRFAEMAIKVGVAWDMTASETGESLAKLQTGLGLTLDQTMSLADAINYLGNNGASSNRDILDVTKRVGPMGKQFGFSAEQVAALGSAMTGAGFESEVAATTILNVGRALTKGDSATKKQRAGFAALGLSTNKVAKSMQKNAVGTLEDVLNRINKLPIEERAAAISNVFGDEARAIGPLISNGKLLTDTMALITDKTKYAGSAFQEYTAQAGTVGNVLSILRNKFWAFFEEMGARWLPTIKGAALGIGDILDSLGERATVFDQIGTAMSGFTNGLGLGDIRQTMNDLGDLLLGPKDGSKSADTMGRIFAKFQEWGRNVREFSDSIKNNPIVKFMEELAPYGGKLALYGLGISLLAGTIRKLASALFFLSGASTIVGAIKAVSTIAGLVGGGAVAATGGAAVAGTAAAGAAGTAGVVARGGMASTLAGLSRVVAAGGIGVLAASTLGGHGEIGAIPDSKVKEMMAAQDSANKAREERIQSAPRIIDTGGLGAAVDGANSPVRIGAPASKLGEPLTAINAAIDRANALVRALPKAPPPAQPSAPSAAMTYERGTGFHTVAPTAEPINAASIASAIGGTQLSVRVTNPPPPPPQPNITVHAPITITGVSDPKAAADSAAQKLGAVLRAQRQSAFTDEN